MDPAVQMQFLKRGGLKRMKLETKDSVSLKIKEIRAKVEKEKAEKIQDGKRRSAGAQKEGNPENPGDLKTANADESGKAGSGQKHVRFWEPPEEFKVDYTPREDVKMLVEGPDKNWGAIAHEPCRSHEGRKGESAPSIAHQLVKDAKALGEGTVLKRLEGASDDMYAWAAARIAREPQLGFRELMSEMATYGLGDLANEAAALLEGEEDGKAGSMRLQVHPAQWSGDGPGRGVLQVDGEQWQFFDYKEEVYMSEELAGVIGVVEPCKERRQCVCREFAQGEGQLALYRRSSAPSPGNAAGTG